MNVPIETDYRKQILDIWYDYAKLDVFYNPEAKYRKLPLAPRTLSKNALLFVGINPSCTNDTVIHDHEKPIGFYDLDINSEEHIPYFKKFKAIADYCGCEWDHLDMLFLRERNQKVIEDLTYDRSEENPLNGINFIGKQLDISFEILERAQPKLIVVSNAFASEFFGKKKAKHQSFDNIWRGYNLEFPNDFDNEIGTYRIKLGNKKVPILFSGMLSGQRALDIGSMERLMWQIKMIMEKSRL